MPAFGEKEHSIHLFQDFVKLANYGSPVYGKPERNNDMYPLKWTYFDHSGIQNGIDQVLGPLSLFAPISQEDATQAVEQLQLERSVTPINEEIKTQPQTFNKMANYVRRRIMAQPNVPFLSMDDQKNLAAIIMGEVNGIWPDIRRQTDDPFLTVEENKELNRRIAVHIVTVCEKLFHHYLHKAQVLNNRGVFSGPANMSRLKVQLALEAGDLLNILKIRRYIVSDIKMSAAAQNTEAEVSPRSTQRTTSTNTSTYKTRLDSSFSRRKHQKVKINRVEHEIKEIENSMPFLDKRHLMELWADLPMRALHLPSEKELHSRPSQISEGAYNTPKIIKKDSSKQKTVFQRCNSQPLLNNGGNLLEELDIDDKVKVDKLIALELGLLHREREDLIKVKTDKKTEFQHGSQDFIKNDLKKLMECERDGHFDGNSDDDLPPLVQAIIRHAKHDDLKQRMEKQLSELRDRQRMKDKEECVYVRDATYPQPDTVSAKLGPDIAVQTSDIRVSERVCMSSMTLKRHATVYNDLLEEINQDTVKNLDTNLFLSDEIHEVYKEIMKTVSASHIGLDDDPQVLNPPESIDLSNTMASATLSRKVLDRIINPAFKKERGPPWEGREMREWAKTPVNPPKNIRGEDIFAAITPDMVKIHDVMHSFGQTSKLSFTEEKLSRVYNSWLQWWKSTTTSDDYMKYLSTQETDFLGAVFHFYDSEVDDSENEGSSSRLHHASWGTHSNIRSKISAEERERLHKLEEIRNLKSEYKKGFWNANTVLMGGLGKDPEIAETKHNARQAPKLESTNKKQASQRMTQEKRDHVLSASKTTTGMSEPVLEDAQDRLESVWQQLYVPDSQRLDMAIKYSCNNYFQKLREAIERWEFVSELILQRETLISQLEKFERQASDPNRFFAKDSKNSIYRLEESKQRAHLYKKIDSLDGEIKEEIEYIHNQFHDVITYKGRPYIDKMKWDRTEMLYWLSEERKQNGISYEAMTQGLNFSLKPVQLLPINSAKLVQL